MKYFLKGYQALGRFLKNRITKSNYSIVCHEGFTLKGISGQLKCLYCERKIPYEKHRTKNGCLWCDDEYWRNK